MIVNVLQEILSNSTSPLAAHVQNVGWVCVIFHLIRVYMIGGCIFG